MRSLFALAFLLTASSIEAQQVLWVDPVLGYNGNPGTYTSPLQTIGTAVAMAGPGDQIHLLSGTYGPLANGDALPISLGIVPQQGLVIRGIGNVVLDLAGSVQTAFRMVNGADGCRITNLTITNSDRLGWWTRAFNSGTGINSANSAMNVEVDRCRFVMLNRVFVLWTNDNVTGWRIHDNLFDDCTNDAILEYSGTNEIYNNTFVTGAYKAYISDSTTSLCYNNLVVGYNIAFEVNNPANNPARFQKNWCWQCTTYAGGAGFPSGLPAGNVIGVDPQLTNVAGHDYHPLPTSGLIENGSPSIFARADLDAVARSVDSNLDGTIVPDIGCYESSPILLQNSWIPGQVLTLGLTSTVANSFGFVLFSFDDGLVTLPGQGPILIDLNTFSSFFLAGPLPQTFYLVFVGVSIPPGTRLVMHGIALVPGAQAFVGGNQVWQQF